MKIQHWMTFATFAEQDYFIYPNEETYDGIIINGNMAAYAPEGLAAFLLQKNRPKISYIIDPLTHAFQHDPIFVSSKKDNGTYELKSSIKNLAESYGGVIRDKAGKTPILPNDFTDEKITDFVKNCLTFQLRHLSTRMSSHEVNKYLDHKEEELRPYCLIAPYLYLKESTYSAWLDLNLKFCQQAIELKNNFESKRIFAALVLDKGILSNKEIIQEIVTKYSALKLDGFLVWIDELEEQNATTSQLKGLLQLASSLRNINNGSEVINLHGGYYSILIASDKLKTPGFTGVAHGPEFGESRAVVPVGGGIPIARYYLPHLHDRIKYADAVGYLRHKNWLDNTNVFFQNVCDCMVCKEVINNDITNFRLFGDSDSKLVRRGNGYVTMQFPTRDAKLNCLKHYLERKVKEFEFVNNSEVNALIQDLVHGADGFQTIIGFDGVSYLRDWKSILQSASHE